MESMSAVKSKKHLDWNVSLITIIIFSTYFAIFSCKALTNSIRYLILTEPQQGRQLLNLPVKGCIIGWQMIIH